MNSNVRRYVSDPKASFFALEDDVDDEEFLKNSRARPPNQGQGQGPHSGRNEMEEKRLQLLDRQKLIEDRSLASTERSLVLLKESEDVGIATGEELQKQREQLERTERSLDNINSTLRTTQRNIDGIKSVFSSMKNYLTRRSEGNAAAAKEKEPKEEAIVPVDRSTYLNDIRANQLPTAQSEHPGLRIRGLTDESDVGPRQTTSHQDRVEQNLDIMAKSISNLKGLAVNLGDEIISQNDLVDNILYKSDRADLSIGKQNKEMNRILKK